MNKTPDNIEAFIPKLPSATLRNGWEQSVYLDTDRDGKYCIVDANVTNWTWNSDGTFRLGYTHEYHSGKEHEMDIVTLLTARNETINFTI